MTDRPDVTQRLTGLAAANRELLRKLLDEKAGRTIPRRDPRARIPLSFSQQRLWLVDQLLQREAAYNQTNIIRLQAPLDVESFRRAVNEIVRRHEILRTTFHSSDGEPFQVVHEPATVEIPLVDLRHAAAEDREAEAMRLIAGSSAARMDLETGPLIRAALYRLHANDHIFALTLHHIVCDGWSMGVFALELSILYASFAYATPIPLPELQLQYGDFAAWQRQWFSDERLSPQLAYWRTQLAGVRDLDLPTDRPRPAHFSYRGSQVPIVITGSLFRALTALAEEHNTTLHIVLLTAMFVLLQRYTGNDDLAIGAPVAGRTRKQLEPLIGFFVNTQVIRANLSGDPTFVELLARVRQVCFAAYANQDVPFERLVDELRPVRNAGRGPLVQAMFQVYQPPSAPGVKREHVFPFHPTPSSSAKFDLDVELIVHPDELRGFVEYNSDLFDEARMERFVAHYRLLLEEAVRDPRRAISTLDILSAEERSRLEAWNETAADYPRDSNLWEQFRLSAAKHASREAVEFDGATITYEELERRAAAVAARLIERGVRPGDCVGLLMTRCLELPVAMAGILASGAFYVPLDPRYPADYLTFQAADSGARVLVTTAPLQSAVSIDLPCVLVDECGDARADMPHVPSESVAWLLYTSGTTGKPKGVPITHRAALRLVHGLPAAPVTPDDSVLQFSPVTFDASVGEVWLALLHGAKLVIHPPELPSAEELGAFVRERGITWTFLTTSLFRQLVENCVSDLRGLRCLLTGGEVMAPAVMQNAWKSLPRTRILHVYGPTECTTFATWYHVADAEAIQHIVPIGRPLANTAVHILDAALNRVPLGVPGEIFIGGPGVSPGYHGRPDLNAQRFVPDPFRPGETLYRTGDMGRFRADGNIEFLGRRDRQVKVSGFRIELGEVEEALAAHPEVTAAVAFVLEKDGDKRLVAFAETIPGSTAGAAALRAHLETALPRHMIPAQLETLERLPLTAHGKVDTAALARLLETSDRGGPRDEPANALETLLAGMWKELLHVPQVGVTDDFFALGGQSLVATRLLSRAKQTFQAAVTMREFFDDPTIRGLATVLARDPRVLDRAELLLKVSSLSSVSP